MEKTILPVMNGEKIISALWWKEIFLSSALEFHLKPYIVSG